MELFQPEIHLFTNKNSFPRCALFCECVWYEFTTIKIQQNNSPTQLICDWLILTVEINSIVNWTFCGECWMNKKSTNDVNSLSHLFNHCIILCLKRVVWKFATFLRHCLFGEERSKQQKRKEKKKRELTALFLLFLSCSNVIRDFCINFHSLLFYESDCVACCLSCVERNEEKIEIVVLKYLTRLSKINFPTIFHSNA